MNKTFGKRLRAARIARDLSRNDLAQILRCSFHTVKSWELDKHVPSSQIIQKLEYTLKTSLAPCDLARAQRADAALSDLKSAILALPEEQQNAAIRTLESLAKSYR